MNCLPCFSSTKKVAERRNSGREKSRNGLSRQDSKQMKLIENSTENGNIAAQTFTFRELATATKNFRPECLLGEGGFGRVYKGCLENTGRTVAVKQLDRNGLQGNKEFLVEVLMLSSLHHENLVNLIGYCADGDQRLLVYEYMPMGSLEDHLLDLEPDQKPLDWYTRMKIAAGAASGLEYLHEKANPPVIYRDLKSANILLNEDFNPKLSDFGLAKLGPVGDKLHVSSRVMGTYGYCAPEYARTGQLTSKSDVYSFGVVLLELITGRRVIDTTRPLEEQNLVSWAQPYFKDQRSFPKLADPALEEDFPVKGLNQAVAVAAMCLQEEASARPFMTDVVIALSFLSMSGPPGSSNPPPAPSQSPPPSTKTPSDTESESEDESQQAVAEAMEWGSNSRPQIAAPVVKMDSDNEEEQDKEDIAEQQRAVSEAMGWGSNSTFNASSPSHSLLSIAKDEKQEKQSTRTSSSSSSSSVYSRTGSS